MPPCKQEISVVEWGAIVKFVEKMERFCGGWRAGFRAGAVEVLRYGGPDFGAARQRFCRLAAGFRVDTETVLFFPVVIFAGL